MAITLGADDKKKIYLLGALLGGLGVVGLFTVIRPLLSGGSSDTPVAINAASSTGSRRNPNGTAMPTSLVMPPNAGGAQFGRPGSTSAAGAGLGAAGFAASGLGAAGSTSATDTTPQIPGIGRTRPDPFIPTVLPALPPPPPSPTPRPTPVPTTIVTDAVPVPLPTYSTRVEDTAVSLPTSPFSSGPQANAQTNLSLPRAVIFGGTQQSAPQPLPLVGGLEVGAPGAQTSATNASGKRVSGVIMGDTIRALIEYQENGQTVSKIVQPGDEVGGMKILSIQRVRSGEQSIVRVTARERGQEVYFDLGPGS